MGVDLILSIKGGLQENVGIIGLDTGKPRSDMEFVWTGHAASMTSDPLYDVCQRVPAS
jgi:hypothetical protein